MRRPKTDATPIALAFPWKQGEHMCVIGTTGTGKSTLMRRLLLSRSDTIVVQTKADRDITWPGKLVRRNRDINDPREARYLLRPEYDAQEREIRAVLERTWKDKGWCLVLDELFYVYDFLKIRREIDRNLTQGRSEGITMLMGMQRPASITRFAMSQSTHILTFYQDGRDALTIAQATGLPKATQLRMAQLGPHEFLWYHVPTHKAWVGRLQDLEREGKQARNIDAAEASRERVAVS